MERGTEDEIGKRTKRQDNTNLGTWMVGTYERLQAASVSGFMVGKQTSDHAQSWTSLSRDWTVALVRPLAQWGLQPGAPSRERERQLL